MNISRYGIKSGFSLPRAQKSDINFTIDSVARRWLFNCSSAMLHIPVHQDTHRLATHNAKFNEYNRSRNKIGLILKNSLDVLLPNTQYADNRESWDRLRSQMLQQNIHLPDWVDNKTLLLRRILPAFKHYEPAIQAQEVVEDLQDAFVVSNSIKDEELSPDVNLYSTKDSEYCISLLANKTKNGRSLIFEDASGNGAHLIKFVSSLLTKHHNFYAIGTDINSNRASVAQQCVQTVGLDHVCQFLPAHALHRASPRTIASQLNFTCDRYITLAFRLIPVLTETKIRRYLRKISNEMQPGDLWCGSIALPIGINYREHSKNSTYTSEQTTFGGTTFFHCPAGLEIEANVAIFTKMIGHFPISRHEGDLKKFILNTYMTKKQFHDLALEYGLKPSTIDGNSKEIPDMYTTYLCVVLEKI